MALIECEECGKQVSDKATSCPNCGCPIAGAQTPSAIQANTNFDGLDYKRFDFEYINKTINNKKIRQKIIQKYKREHKREGTRYLIFGIALVIFSMLLTQVHSRGFWGFIMFISFFGGLFLFVVGVLSKFKFSFEHIVEDRVIENYYTKHIQFIKKNLPNNYYEELLFLTATSKEDLIHQAYKLKADAILDSNVQAYSTQNVKNDIGGKGVHTDVHHHEKWSGMAIRLKYGKYHDEIDIEKELLNN